MVNNFSRGVENSLVYFNSSYGQWVFQSYRSPDRFLVTKSDNPALVPVGRETWYSVHLSEL